MIQISDIIGWSPLTFGIDSYSEILEDSKKYINKNGYYYQDWYEEITPVLNRNAYIYTHKEINMPRLAFSSFLVGTYILTSNKPFINLIQLMSKQVDFGEKMLFRVSSDSTLGYFVKNDILENSNKSQIIIRDIFRESSFVVISEILPNKSEINSKYHIKV